MASTLVELCDVTKEYGSVAALNGVSVDIHGGEFHGIVGPNGSGKTTLIRVIAALARPTAGTIRRADVAIGYSFQEPRFFPELTVRENLKVFRAFDDAPPDATWQASLTDRLGLDLVSDRKAGELSGGFRKRLDIALGFVKAPDLVLLDEPFADIDDSARNDILDVITAYHEAGHTVVVSTHHIEAFASAFDRVTILVDGQLRYGGRPGDDLLALYYAHLPGADRSQPTDTAAEGRESAHVAPLSEGPIECPHCGESNRAGASFCSRCGNRVD